ncbi:hypothetical protein OF83DRAFT_155191 [Amylostereum chailletii]|nr:hypothetical protein OF83DRAFT_155191 [Amylostereum chailletii]
MSSTIQMSPLSALSVSTSSSPAHPQSASHIESPYIRPKAILNRLTFLGSWAGLNFKCIPLPCYDDGTPVPDDEYIEYYKTHTVTMPFCFCGIDKLDTPRKAANLFIAKGGLEKNVGRPCFGCATVSCPYFVNVSELKQRCDDRGVILACTSYPLREYVDDSACRSLAVEHRNATPGPSGHDDVLVKEDPDFAAEHQIGAFDDPFGACPLCYIFLTLPFSDATAL